MQLPGLESVPPGQPTSRSGSRGCERHKLIGVLVDYVVGVCAGSAGDTLGKLAETISIKSVGRNWTRAEEPTKAMVCGDAYRSRKVERKEY